MMAKRLQIADYRLQVAGSSRLKLLFAIGNLVFEMAC